MNQCAAFFLLAAAAGTLAAQDGSNIVFRSDVSLVRVDAQVVDRNNRAIAGLTAADFVLRDEGQQREIRNFTSEQLPVDVLLLLDVSASMRPHVQRIADAADQAMSVLKDQDRVGIMVFDRNTRLRLPLRDSRSDVGREFKRLLRQEDFDGGTDITRGLLDAADYIGREGRTNARRAILIVTDDETELDRDEAAVGNALTRANAVLFALIAPDAMHSGYSRRRDDDTVGQPSGGTWPGSGGQWPGGGLGGIIFGRRGGSGGGGGGRRYPRRVGTARTQSAGTEQIARDSGGDSASLEEAQSFESMLARIRQRYALNFYVPPDAKPNQQRSVDVQLADSARRNHPDAQLRYRKTYITPATVTASADSAQPAAADQAQSGGWRKIK